MRVLTVIGNRPQFIKAAAVSPPLRAVAEEILVHTGQHHDDALSQVFFTELGLPAPDVQLDVSGGSNTSQTARMLAALEPVIAGAAPDAVLVYGDTNSTLAGTLAAVQAGVPVAHVEAGMRSYDRTMPEEVNRVVCDHLSGLLLCSSDAAAENLAAEGIGLDASEAAGPEAGHGAASVQVVGDVMVDVAIAVQRRVRAGAAGAGAAPLATAAASADAAPAPGDYVLATAHRAGNVDDPRRLAQLVGVLEDVAAVTPVVLPLHPRTRARLVEFGLIDRLAQAPGVELRDPVGYVDLAGLLVRARAVLTDSGGLQKEAYLAGVPCVTLRPSTEWVETVDAGWNTLVDLDPAAALAALVAPVPARHPSLYGDGHAGARVVEAIAGWLDAGGAVARRPGQARVDCGPS